MIDWRSRTRLTHRWKELSFPISTSRGRKWAGILLVRDQAVGEAVGKGIAERGNSLMNSALVRTSLRELAGGWLVNVL